MVAQFFLGNRSKQIVNIAVSQAGRFYRSPTINTEASGYCQLARFPVNLRRHGIRSLLNSAGARRRAKRQPAEKSRSSFPCHRNYEGTEARLNAPAPLESPSNL